MYVVMGWFSRRSLPSPGPDDAALFGGPTAKVDRALAEIVPDSYTRCAFSGADWGVTVCEVGERDAWRWPVVDTDGDVTAISLGIPLGLPTESGAAALARRLLAGEDLHADVAPPFGLLALDGDLRLVIQQDWLGMCRLFHGEADDTVYFATRPGLVAEMISDRRTPDHDGWASYVACGHFGGESSPYSGVSLLAPGERLSFEHRTGGGWDVSSQIRTTIDDLVQRGLAARSQSFDALLDLAASGITAATAGLHRIYGAPITMGLSGGKDSRLVAASLLTGGMVPHFRTNIDTAAEGEIAGRLVEIMRERRGLRLDHDLVLVGNPDLVMTIGLQDRIQRLQFLHDYQFPSTYTVRNTGTGALPERATAASFTGAGGELATGYWYLKEPVDDNSRADATRTIAARLFAACGPAGPTASVLHQQSERVSALIDRGEAAGLRGLELVEYVYLIERVRRWYSSAYTVGMVTPFLSPGFVSASFALTPQQKRARALHTSLLARFAPEWADVPFVSISTGPSTAAHIWDGDGLEVVHTLYDTVQGPLISLMRRDTITKAVVRCADGRGNSINQKVLQQFAAIALASKDLEPQGVRHPTQTYDSFLRAHRRTPSRLGPIVRQIQRSAVGRAVVNRVKRAIR